MKLKLFYLWDLMLLNIKLLLRNLCLKYENK